MGDLFDMLGGRGRRGPRKADDTVHKFAVPIKDFYMGTTKCVRTAPCATQSYPHNAEIACSLHEVLFKSLHGVLTGACLAMLACFTDDILCCAVLRCSHYLAILLCLAVVSAHTSYALDATATCPHMHSCGCCVRQCACLCGGATIVGACRRMQMSRPVKCSQCGGTGSKSRVPTTCERCKGTGGETVVRQMGPMLTQMQQTCSRCSGSGRSVKPGDACPGCRGNAVINESKKFEVTLDKGAPDGHKQVLRGEGGSDDPNVEPGDIVFVFTEADTRAEAGWQRQGNDLLVTEFPISLKQALCGTEVHVRHLDGHVVKVQRPPGTCIKGGDFYRVPNEGMPLHGRPYSKGNLYVRFSIQMPTALDVPALQQLASILPDDGESETMDADDAEEVEQQQVGSIDKLKEELQYRMRGYRQAKAATDEDDDEGLGGGQAVRCAQQ